MSEFELQDELEEKMISNAQEIINNMRARLARVPREMKRQDITIKDDGNLWYAIVNMQVCAQMMSHAIENLERMVDIKGMHPAHMEVKNIILPAGGTLRDLQAFCEWVEISMPAMDSAIVRVSALDGVDVKVNPE